MLYQSKNREFPMEVTIFPQAFDSFSDYVFHNNLLKNLKSLFMANCHFFMTIIMSYQHTVFHGFEGKGEP